MNYSTPESVGISSKGILNYLSMLENNGLCPHSLIIYRKGSIVFEKYWEPFDSDFVHRMYSVTKSFVSMAIGLLVSDGKIDLDDPISKYFPNELKDQTDENMKDQTIRHMLMMSTAKPSIHWFDYKPADRVAFYFANTDPISRPSGTIFSYDSNGSFILGSLVERITGKRLLEFLRERVLNRIGFSSEAFMLSCPGGHSWSDSALICKPTDLLKTAILCMHKGNWEGVQLIDRDYMTAATSKQIDNNVFGTLKHNSFGYGYQFWMTYDNSFSFNGMGSQFAICTPDKDMVMVTTGDNQGYVEAGQMIFENYFNMIVRTATETALPDDLEAQKELDAFRGKLLTVKGKKTSPIVKEIDGVTYDMAYNTMGLKNVSFRFENDGGVFCYENADGYKEIPFGMCENLFGRFPQKGYADKVGTVASDKLYKCAASGAWATDDQLIIKVQIIDDYFGNLNITAGFRPDGKLGLFMKKTAEDFLTQYDGFAGGIARE
ncbi:MAG: beta-lactamase family protein [Clostridia bacterium]|nr:beta-lactamase family protein [Clostridia bacterium]